MHNVACDPTFVMRGSTIARNVSKHSAGIMKYFFLSDLLPILVRESHNVTGLLIIHRPSFATETHDIAQDQ